MKISIIKSSGKNPTSSFTSTANISTLTPSSKESEMLTFTEDQELYLRVSESQTGPPLTSNTVGNSILIQEMLGKMPFMILEVNGLPPNLQEKDRNPMSSNGSDSNNGVRAALAGCSTTKSQTLPGLGTEAI